MATSSQPGLMGSAHSLPSARSLTTAEASKRGAQAAVMRANKRRASILPPPRVLVTAPLSPPHPTKPNQTIHTGERNPTSPGPRPPTDMAAAAGSSAAPLPAPISLNDKAAAVGGGVGGDRAAGGCGVCAICLDRIPLQETALVKGCDHAYCVTCILRWASYKQTPVCPQCKHPFEFLSVHRSLDGCLHDYMFDESVCLLLRATWFKPLVVEAHEEAQEEEDIYRSYQYDDGDEDDLYEEYISRSPSIRIGNRRWGDNGYVRGGRREARPVVIPPVVDAVPSRTPKKKEGSASGSGSGSVSKDVAGRRARRAQKREAADKAAAEKHLKLLQRLGRGKTSEAPPEAPESLEVGPPESLEVGPPVIE
ncbi:uncharacterized protein LOC119273138 [Triticum dicoccoides]|uniref:uncharacterized protein LOC119273138 n=1 Tax=Triticum dicoccoides TaxID=85692 RepID=UPI00188DF822|nr:uncharacterized protein LOC119273138 [Triticum dicoccoides]